MTAVQLDIETLPTPLALREKVELIVQQGDREAHYWTRVEEIEDHAIVVSEPELIAGLASWYNGAPVTVVVARDDAAYQFTSRLTILRDQQSLRFRLALPDKMQRLQRRRTVRLDLLMDLSVMRVLRTNDQAPESPPGHWQPARSVNISGDGILLRTDAEIAVGDRLILKFDSFVPQGLPAVIAGVCRRQSREHDRYCVGIEFVVGPQVARFFSAEELARLPREITEFDIRRQNTLINFIFRQQVQLRRKGLL